MTCDEEGQTGHGCPPGRGFWPRLRAPGRRGGVLVVLRVQREKKEGECRADSGGRWRWQSASPRRRRRFVDSGSTRVEGCSERCKRRSRGSSSAYIEEGRERNQRPARRNAINGQGTGGFDLKSIGALKGETEGN
jgi:hypothetical protein